MNKIQLKEKLDLLGIDERRYSLNGDLNPDAIILFKNYDAWEVFYFDERGGRNDERTFLSESGACDYIYIIWLESKGIEEKFGIKT